MRQLTEVEKTLLLTIQTQWVRDTSLAGMPTQAVAFGFTAGLDFQAQRVAELEARIAALEAIVNASKVDEPIYKTR